MWKQRYQMSERGSSVAVNSAGWSSPTRTAAFAWVRHCLFPVRALWHRSGHHQCLRAIHLRGRTGHGYGQREQARRPRANHKRTSSCVSLLRMFSEREAAVVPGLASKSYRFCASSKLFGPCGTKYACLPLGERPFVCPVFDHTQARDLHARYVRHEGLKDDENDRGSLGTPRLWTGGRDKAPGCSRKGVRPR